MPMRWRWPPENSCGIAPHRVGAQPDLVEQLGDARLALLRRDVGVVLQRLGDDAAGRHARIERRVRVLEHHLHALAVRAHRAGVEMRDVLAVEADRAGGRLDQAQQQRADRRLAAAGLADEAERLARRDREADAVDRLDRRTDRREQPAAAARKCLFRSVDLERAASCGHRRGQHALGVAARRRCGRRPHRSAASRRLGAAALDRDGRSAARRRSPRSARAATAPMPGISCEPLGARAAPRARRGSRPAARACRDARAGRTARATGASSTLRPAYITTTRWQVSATTPRSWVIRMTAAPVRSFSSQHQRRGSAPGWSRRAPWSARRRSAACGLQASAMAIITRWRMPPENWCG